MRDDLTIQAQGVNPIAFGGKLCFIVSANYFL
jgi:hypothetical protein